MEQNVNELIQIIKNHEQEFSNDYQLAFKKFELWHAYIERVVQESKDNPNIKAMAFTQKLIAYTGIIESLNLGKGPVEKFEKFFDKFDEHEKFLVMVAVKIGKPGEKEQREEKVVDAYLKNSGDFDNLFRKTINNQARDALGLYNFRSRLVHQGEFVIPIPIPTILSTGAILSYSSLDLGLRMMEENVISLDEMFLRGFCKIVKINAPSLESRAKEFLERNHYVERNLQLYMKKFSR